MGLFGLGKKGNAVKGEKALNEGIAAYEAGDYKKALKLYEEAARLGNSAAQFNAGSMYYTGKGMTVDKAKALFWYEKAAEQGSADAQFFCGVMHYNGDGTEVNLDKAVYWHEKAAAQGVADSQFICGIMYSTVNKAKSIYWFERAAEQGHEGAIAQLNTKQKKASKAPESSGNAENQVQAEADNRTNESAAVNGQANVENADKLFDEGLAAYNAGDLAKAFPLFEKAAKLGHAAAQFCYGVLYDKGEGTALDKAKALYWFEKAAAQGQINAQFNCGNLYSKGEGTAVDKARALYWYEKAAGQGDRN